MNTLTSFYTLRIRRIYIWAIIAIICAQWACMLVASWNLAQDKARQTAQLQAEHHQLYHELEAERAHHAHELADYSNQLKDDIYELTLSHCFNSTDWCLEFAWDTIKLPTGQPASVLLPPD